MVARRRGESRRDRDLLAALDFAVRCEAEQSLHAASVAQNNARGAEVYLELTSRACQHVTRVLVCGFCAVRYQQASRLTCRCGVSAVRSEWSMTTRSLPTGARR